MFVVDGFGGLVPVGVLTVDSTHTRATIASLVYEGCGGGGMGGVLFRAVLNRLFHRLRTANQLQVEVYLVSRLEEEHLPA
jgi:hypothetical protein